MGSYPHSSSATYLTKLSTAYFALSSSPTKNINAVISCFVSPSPTHPAYFRQEWLSGAGQGSMAAARGHRQPPSLQVKSEGSSPAAAQHSPLLTASAGTGLPLPLPPLLLDLHLGMQTLPFLLPQAEPVWLPQLLPPGSLSLDRKGRRSAEVSSRCCCFPTSSTAWLSRVAASGPDPERAAAPAASCLGQ